MAAALGPMTEYYKVLDHDGSAFHGGNGKWSLPSGDKPGKWMSAISDPEPCERGYHLCRRDDLINWLGPTIYLAEGRGAMVEANDKVVFEQARLLYKIDAWNETTALLFAADCAERVFWVWNKYGPKDADWHPRQTILVVRRYARGLASNEELAAAWTAARTAARTAAGDAAWTAARTAARTAAGAAAGAAARTAARTAAGTAARTAARTAAGAAAGAAARTAAWAAAGAAAGDAAWTAAGDAAWTAARDAEITFQNHLLFSYLDMKW